MAQVSSIPWFPVMKEQLIDVKFQALTPTEKVFFWTLASDFNALGQFYRADIEYSVILNVSISKIRDARRKFQNLLFLDCQPGFQVDGKNIATSYFHVDWARPVSGCGQYSKIQRFTFEVGLCWLREGVIRHRDMAVLVYLMHLQRQANRCLSERPLIVSRAYFAGLSGINDPFRSLDALREIRCSRGNSLVRHESTHRELVITFLGQFNDPRIDEWNRAEAHRMDAELRTLIQAKRSELELAR